MTADLLEQAISRLQDADPEESILATFSVQDLLTAEVWGNLSAAQRLDIDEGFADPEKNPLIRSKDVVYLDEQTEDGARLYIYLGSFRDGSDNGSIVDPDTGERMEVHMPKGTMADKGSYKVVMESIDPESGIKHVYSVRVDDADTGME